jgi:hypothetical protein
MTTGDSMGASRDLFPSGSGGRLRRGGTVLGLLALTIPIQPLAGQTFGEVVSFINRLGGWQVHTPLPAQPAYLYWVALDYEARIDGTILTVTRRFASVMRQTVADGTICSDGSRQTTSWVVDVRDLAPGASIKDDGAYGPGHRYSVNVGTINNLPLIRETRSQSLPDCPHPPWALTVPPIWTPVSAFGVQFLDLERATRLVDLLAAAIP